MTPSKRNTIFALLVLWPLFGAGHSALASPEADFYQAYYLQQAKGEAKAALVLYENAAKARELPAALREEAGARAAACREELKAADLSQLFPPETFLYVELSQPGGHLERLLRQLGLVGTPQEAAGAEGSGPLSTVRISPTLLSAFSRFKGAAVGIMGFNLFKLEPQWVAVIDPGTDELIRGAMESAVATAGKPGKKVGAAQTFLVEVDKFTVHVALASRLIVVSQQESMVTQALQRLADESLESLAKSEVLGPVLAGRQHAMVFAAADFQKLQGLVRNLMMAGKNAAPQIAIAQALLDFESFRSASFQAGVAPDGLFMEAGLNLAEGHRSLVINLLRTPSLSRDTLQYVPGGAAAVMMFALGESDGQAAGPAKADTLRQFTGLDIGREFFANIQEVALFLLPPSSRHGPGAEGGASGPVVGGMRIPDVGLAMTVRDPSRSQAIWTQLLGLPSLALGQPKTSAETLKIADHEVQVYEWPSSIKVYFAATRDAILVALNERVIRDALHARGTPADCLLKDTEFAPILGSLGKDTSKAYMVHAGRVLEVAKPWIPPKAMDEVGHVQESISNLVVCVQTRETPNSLHLSARVSGLPDLGRLIQEMGGLNMAFGGGRHKAKLASATDSGAGDEEMAAKDKKAIRKTRKSGRGAKGENPAGDPGAAPAADPAPSGAPESDERASHKGRGETLY